MAGLGDVDRTAYAGGMAPLSPPEVDRYLRRIAVPDVTGRDRETLTRLQAAHLRAVPFENLDIHRDVPIALDPDRIVEKIVDRHRGGYCYEANSSFGRLLAALGYDVTMVSARVVRDGEVESQEFAHLALLVAVDGEPERFLTDVAFGDAFDAPMPLVDGFERVERFKRVRLVRRGDRWAYQDDRGDGWEGGYTFDTVPRSFGDYAEMNVWQQTAPESYFRTQPMCTILTDAGRVTLAGNRLIETGADGRVEREVDDAELDAIRRERFGIVLE